MIKSTEFDKDIYVFLLTLSWWRAFKIYLMSKKQLRFKEKIFEKWLSIWNMKKSALFAFNFFCFEWNWIVFNFLTCLTFDIRSIFIVSCRENAFVSICHSPITDNFAFLIRSTCKSVFFFWCKFWKWRSCTVFLRRDFRLWLLTSASFLTSILIVPNDLPMNAGERGDMRYRN